LFSLQNPTFSIYCLLMSPGTGLAVSYCWT
jgi:hypothetical protein